MKDTKPYPVDPSYSDPPVVETDYSTWDIVKAVQYGIMKRVIELVEPSDTHSEGFDVNQLDDEDVSLLHWAAINNRLAIARYLLSKGAVIDRPGGHLAATPLHWAIRQSHLSMVHFLMQRGADPRFMDNTGLGCFHVAIQMGNVPVIVYLLVHGIDVDGRDANGLTPLMIACMHVRSVDVFRLLISYGSNLRLTDSRGNTAAHYAVNFANFQAVIQLDKGDVDWNAINDEGKTPHEVRVVPWLTDRVKQMATVQSMKNSSHRLSRLGLSLLHYSPVWRHRITVILPPLILITCGLLINWDLRSTLYRLNFIDQPLSISSWIIYSTKFILLLLLSVTARFIIDRFSDHKSQAVMLFSLATSTTLLLTTTYLFHITLRTPDHWMLHFCFLFFITLLWTTFILSCTKNPGYIGEVVKKDYNRETIAELFDEMLTNSNDITLANSDNINEESPLIPSLSTNPLQRFCTTCFIRKPLRSKHCSTCDRCVARFDHHCPWIYNCVGMQNHFYFIVYLLATTVSCGLFMMGTITYWRNEFTCSSNLLKHETTDILTKLWIYLSCNPWITFCFINAAFYSFWTTLLFVSQLYQMVWLNTTTNERMNIDRYVEFNLDTKSSNQLNNNNKFLLNDKYNYPYDHGVWRNLLDLIGLPGFVLNSNKRVDWRCIHQIEQLNFPNSMFNNHINDIDKKLQDW
ncbi:Palmitoyltransferase ZDHHC17 [Schistosoma japonicum]|nr:Palmitoyltransferase ZDHHC17 [Schistosoma japonicum]